MIYWHCNDDIENLHVKIRYTSFCCCLILHCCSVTVPAQNLNVKLCNFIARYLLQVRCNIVYFQYQSNRDVKFCFICLPGLPYDPRIIPWKFGDDISNGSEVIMLTNKQTDRQTDKVTNRHYRKQYRSLRYEARVVKIVSLRYTHKFN